MKYRRRTNYSESQKALMWERWQKGDSLQQIAQLFDRNHSTVQGILSRTGGIRPASRRRSRLALTLAEREEISRAVVTGQSIRSVARQLGRPPLPSAVSYSATAGSNATGQSRLTRWPGIGPAAPRAVNW